MLKAVGVKNFRCFEDTGLLELSPITVYVGLNNSGKSSFLRIFPLLRQSIESKTAGPLLWYGDYVDLGSYAENVNEYGENEDIVFSFEFLIEGETYILHVTFSLDSDTENTQISSIQLLLSSFEIRLTIFSEEKMSIILNGKEIEESSKLLYFYYKNGIFLPLITDLKKDYFLIDFKFNEQDSISMLASKNIKFILKPYLPSNVVDYDFNKKINIISAEKRQRKLDLIEALCNNFIYDDSMYYIPSTSDRFEEKIKNITEDELRQLSTWFDLINLNYFLSEINNEFYQESQSIRYIAPLRAVAERFYRYQDLEIDEVDSEGENLSMVLRSFSKEQRKAFEVWTEANLDFVVKTHKNGAHYEIKIKTSASDTYRNLADMGFGYSQILPVITSLWLEIVNPQQLRKTITFVIEQPELHLHPGYQASFANLICKLVNVAKQKNIDLKFILETHSETLINMLGYNIEQGIIEHTDASVYLFEKGDDDKISQVKKSSFTAEGYLKNWPYGFFEADL